MLLSSHGILTLWSLSCSPTKILSYYMPLWTSFAPLFVLIYFLRRQVCIYVFLAYCFFPRWILCWFYCSCMHEIMQYAFIIQCGCLIITRVYTAVIGTKKNDVANLQYVACYGKKWPRLWFLPPVRLSILVRVVNLSGVCHKFWI